MENLDFWRDRATFVTGATGLLGAHLTRRLIQQGANVIVLTRDEHPHSLFAREHLAKNVTIVRGDCRDEATLRRVLAEYEINTVFHLAAQTLVGPANLDPTTTFETNIAGTWKLLEASRTLPHVRQIILASSDKAYGEQEVLPYIESARLEGRQPYAVSKSCADLIAQTYHSTYGTPVSITRCGNFYGAGDLNWNRIVPGTIRSLLQGHRPVIRSDGHYLRDYIYIEDGADAYMQLAQKMGENRDLCGQAFNLGHNAPISVLELVHEISLACGREDLTPDVRGETRNEILLQSVDATKAHDLLNWAPKFDLKTGLERTVPWYRDFLS